MGPTMRDSGNRRTFETGAVRDRDDSKPRPDLISPHANLREGAWLGVGARKYRPRNWEAGMPISECVASICRHLEAYKLGRCDEDHMAAIRTNAGFILHYEEEIKVGRLPAILDDMPHYASRTIRTSLKGNTPEERLQDLYDQIASREPLGGRVASKEMAEEHTPTEYTMPMRSPSFTVYLCGPITGQEIDQTWRDNATAMLQTHGIKTLDPLRGKKREHISNQGLSYKGQLAAPEIAERDRMDIEEADVILAHFPYTPPRQAIGSLMEMGAAAIGLKKPVILCTAEKVFQDHLFCRNFCTMEPDFTLALNRIAAIAHAKVRDNV
jgi:nucleoside 2-deoxyribosyltransferase